MQDLIDFAWTHIPQIAGGLIMAFVVAYLAGLNNRLNRLAAASANFRNVFLTELKGIYPIPFDWPKEGIAIDNRLRKAFPNLQAAVTEFKHFIPWYRRKLFDRAWFRYRCSTGRKIDIQCYHHYMPFEGVSIIDGKEIRYDNTKVYKETFKKNVDSLLKYAKQT
jgi:hypothetical protein